MIIISFVNIWRSQNSKTLLKGALIDITNLKNYLVVISEIHICIPYNKAISPVGIYPTDMYRHIHQNPYKNIPRSPIGNSQKLNGILYSVRTNYFCITFINLTSMITGQK